MTYIRSLGDRKAIEEITTVWNKLVINRTAEMEEWTPAIEKLLNGRPTICAFSHNNFPGFAPASAKAFSEMLDREIATRTTEPARLSFADIRQTELF